MWIEVHKNGIRLSRYTYRCAVLPDGLARLRPSRPVSLNALTGAWRSLTRAFSPLIAACLGLNAPTGAWCSLTLRGNRLLLRIRVSMHLQVRGAP